MGSINLDSILNFVIPIAVWCFLAYILYKPFKEPIDSLINKIKDWKEGKSDSGYEDTFVKSITYE